MSEDRADGKRILPGGSIQLLYEQPGLPAYELPEPLAHAYSGSVGFPESRLYANFVSSVDGVVAFQDRDNSGSIISGRRESDRFVMGLLRACADIVLIGAGTLRTTPEALWTAGDIYPPATAEYAELRRWAGRAAYPRLAVVTGRGDIDPDHRALQEGALLLTGEASAERLRAVVPASSTVIPAGPGTSVDINRALEILRSEGGALLLCEGGPALIGQLVQRGTLDELFLTLAPALAGRRKDDPRAALIDGVAFEPDALLRGRLASIRQDESFLFLRYLLQEP